MLKNKKVLHALFPWSTVSELKQGSYKAFWESLTPEIRSRYIGVIPKVVEVNVGPFGY